MAFRWFAVSFVVSFFEAVAISLCLAGNLLEWTLIDHSTLLRRVLGRPVYLPWLHQSNCSSW